MTSRPSKLGNDLQVPPGYLACQTSRYYLSAWPLIADLLLLRAWMVVQPFRLDVMDLANGCDYYVRHGGDDKRTEDLALMILHIDGKR
jgi:hypothetical protein